MSSTTRRLPSRRLRPCSISPRWPRMPPLPMRGRSIAFLRPGRCSPSTGARHRPAPSSRTVPSSPIRRGGGRRMSARRCLPLALHRRLRPAASPSRSSSTEYARTSRAPFTQGTHWRSCSHRLMYRPHRPPLHRGKNPPPLLLPLRARSSRASQRVRRSPQMDRRSSTHRRRQRREVPCLPPIQRGKMSCLLPIRRVKVLRQSRRIRRHHQPKRLRPRAQRSPWSH